MKMKQLILDHCEDISQKSRFHIVPCELTSEE